ncbi:MAG: hypothetical protein ACKPCM_06940, partial [Pseudanabaena sp.]
MRKATLVGYMLQLDGHVIIYISCSSYLRQTPPPSQGVYIGQASSTSYVIDMAASSKTTKTVAMPGTNYKNTKS